MNLTQLQERVKVHRTSFDLAKANVSDMKTKWKLSQALHEAALEAQAISQAVAQEIQNRVHKQIANVVSSCLESVFDEPYEFHIDFERKRGRTEASMTFHRDGIGVDPMTASGGGVVDVAAFALRLSCLLLARPRLRGVLIMDEPFKFVSEGFRERIREMLEDLSVKMSIQFIFVTHIDELKTGNIVVVNA